MDIVLSEVSEWLKEVLISGILDNLTNLFTTVNDQVGSIATDMATTPADFAPGVFALVQNVSETVILPVAGILLTFICAYELIQMIIEHNQMANFETFTLFKWVMKTFFAVTLITNTFDIVMAVFDVAQNVIASSSDVIVGSTAVSDLDLAAMQTALEAMEVGPLLGLYLQSAVIGLTMRVLTIAIFIIVYGRMIEIYLMSSLAPIPMATFGNREQSMMGQNYLRSLFAIGFQGFLILICVGIYAVLVQGITVSEDIIASVWGIVGYTVLLTFTLFKTGSLSKAILGAH